MYRRAFLSVVSMALTVLVPLQTLGQESASGMVYANGSATVNGSEIPQSVAVFPGDQLETKPDSSATIGSNGSSVTVFSNSLVTYEGTSAGVDRGSVRITTASGFEAHACEVRARPASNIATQYQFAHTDGHVTVMAIKGDVIVEDHPGASTERSKADQESKTGRGSTIVKEGEQTTRDDGCEKAPKRRPSPAVGIGNPPVLYTGIGITGGILIWWLIHEHGHKPVSPACPSNSCP